MDIVKSAVGHDKDEIAGCCFGHEKFNNLIGILKIVRILALTVEILHKLLR